MRMRTGGISGHSSLGSGQIQNLQQLGRRGRGTDDHFFGFVFYIVYLFVVGFAYPTQRPPRAQSWHLLLRQLRQHSEWYLQCHRPASWAKGYCATTAHGAKTSWGGYVLLLVVIFDSHDFFVAVPQLRMDRFLMMRNGRETLQLYGGWKQWRIFLLRVPLTGDSGKEAVRAHWLFCSADVRGRQPKHLQLNSMCHVL